MTTFTETLPHGDGFLIAEGNGDISRETLTIAAGQTLRAGAVIGRITASGKYAAYDQAATDGTETAAGILRAAVDAAAADTAAVAIVRLATVKRAALVFKSDQDAAAQAAALVDLASSFLIAR